MSNFEFSLYLSQFLSSSNITGFLFTIQFQRYPLLFSTIIGSKVMKANARIAGNSACQDLSYLNWGRLDHYKAVMKLFFGGKRAQNNFKCSYNSYWQANFGILWLSSKEKILCHFFVRLGSFTKVDISLLLETFVIIFISELASYISSFPNICLYNFGTNNCRKN